MVAPVLDKSCYACGGKGNYSVMLAFTGERIYIPNQIVRSSRPPHPGYEETVFCARCMRKIEDNVRATIMYLQSESN
jgi:hypothetical protein